MIKNITFFHKKTLDIGALVLLQKKINNVLRIMRYELNNINSKNTTAPAATNAASLFTNSGDLCLPAPAVFNRLRLWRQTNNTTI